MANNDDFYVHEIAIEGVSTFKTRLSRNRGVTGADTPSLMSILQGIQNINSNFRYSPIDLGEQTNARDPGKINAPDPDIGSIRYI